QDAQPGPSEDPDRVRMVTAAGASLPIDSRCPGIGVARVVGPRGRGLAQSFVAGEAASDAAVFAGAAGNRGHAGLGSELRRGGAPATVGVALEESREALLAEPYRTVGGGVGVEEREGDRGVDVGKQRRGAGPEALQQAAELIGELDASRHEIVACADGRPE